MVFIYLIAFIVLCITIFSITDIYLDHQRELERIKREDFMCQKCREETPVVIVSEPRAIFKGDKY